MQYAKMKAALSERDSVEGEGSGQVEKGCKPMLSVPGVVRDVSTGPGTSKLSLVLFFPFFHLKLLITKPHLQMSERENTQPAHWP